MSVTKSSRKTSLRLDLEQINCKQLTKEGTNCRYLNTIEGILKIYDYENILIVSINLGEEYMIDAVLYCPFEQKIYFVGCSENFICGIFLI
jgi:hypothetical protein